MEIRYVGGVFGGNIQPTPFLCLTLKMLQIQPEKDIVVEFIKNEEFKYVRALGGFYLRLTGSAIDCYKYLEPLYNDNRKLRRQNRAGQYEIVHMDEYIDELLRSDRVCDVILPRLQKRIILEENNELEPKVSALDDDLDEDASDDERANPIEEEIRRELYEGSSKKKHERKDRDRRSRSPARRDRDRSAERHRDRERDRDRRGERRGEKDRHGNRGERDDRDRTRYRERDRDYGRERDDRRDRKHGHSSYDDRDRRRH